MVDSKSGDGRAGREDLADEESIDGGGNVEVEGVELMMEDERRIGKELELVLFFRSANRISMISE